MTIERACSWTNSTRTRSRRRSGSARRRGSRAARHQPGCERRREHGIEDRVPVDDREIDDVLLLRRRNSGAPDGERCIRKRSERASGGHGFRFCRVGGSCQCGFSVLPLASLRHGHGAHEGQCEQQPSVRRSARSAAAATGCPAPTSRSGQQADREAELGELAQEDHRVGPGTLPCSDKRSANNAFGTIVTAPPGNRNGRFPCLSSTRQPVPGGRRRAI